MAASRARRLALHALLNVADGMSAADALHRQIAAVKPNEQDRALATELVYGTIRWLKQLDWIIDYAARRGRHRPKPPVRQILQLAAYELLHLPSIPPRATCHQAVELARWRHRRAAPFVNAICRRMQAIVESPPPDLWPDRQAEPVRYFAVRFSHPEWIVERWIERYGAERAEALLKANNVPPPLTVRVNRRLIDRDALRARWDQSGIEASHTALSPDGLHVKRARGVTSLPGFNDGLFTVQDEASQLVARAVAPLPGERVLDLCSAPGGKTTHIAELMDDTGTIVALDLDPSRLALLAENVRRLRLTSIEACPRDALTLAPGELGYFSRVLLDAPCTGLGVLRRRAEARWQKWPDDIRRLAALQAKLLDGAAAQVSPGGVIVYSTCTTEPEETVHQVRAFLARHPAFRADSLRAVLPDAVHPFLGSDPSQLSLSPADHGTDGFFIARFVRVA